MTPVQAHLILELLFPLLLELISGICQPPVALHQDRWSQVLGTVPPVTRAGCRAACAENTLIQTIKLLTVGNALQDLLPGGGILALEIGLDGSVLLVELGEVGNKVLDNVCVREGVDLGSTMRFVCDAAEAGKGIDSIDVHGTGAANTLTTRSAEGEGGVHFVLDTDEGVENHRSLSS